MKKILLTLFTITAGFCHAQQISEADLRKHITYLASDKLEGREPGTKGEKQAAKYLEKQYKQYKLKPLGTKGYLQNFSYKTSLNPHDTAATGKEKRGTNVIGFLDNGMPNTIVIGGHYDHLGSHEHNSSLDREKAKGVIHNGADDNASGTAGVLALADYFTNNGVKENTNFLFICFSGEEDGLIGSKYFTNNPTLPLDKITCMINMDMIGRLNDTTQKLLVFGVGTSPAYTKTFSSVNHGTLKLAYDSSGIGPSDQTSFYLKNIPVLHFFSGQHMDYHKSSDDADKINYKGEKEILELIARVSMQLSNEPKLAFTATKQPEQGKVSFKVSLGIMPDYAYDGKGVKADAVTEGKPAAKAGIVAGDVITKLGEKNIENIYDYMKALGSFKKDDKVAGEVLRGSEKVKVEIVF